MSNSNVKISIIIPVYNVAKYLKQCLNKIINQTLKDIEIICIDDCSTDESLSILEKYAQKDNRIVIIKQEKNQGQGVARNIGIERARGEYIGFVDPDDWVKKSMYETMYNQAKELNSDIVICNYKRYLEKEDKYKKSGFLRNTDENYNKDIIILPTEVNLTQEQIDSILLISPCFSVNKIYRRELIKSFNIQFSKHRCYEDIQFVLESFFNANNISYTNEKLYFYRYRKSSTLRTLSDRFDILMEINVHIKNILIKYNKYEHYKHNFYYFIIANIIPIKENISTRQKIRYYNDSKKYLDKYALSVLKNKLELGFWHNVFSITDKKIDDQKYRVIRILGIRIKIKQNEETNVTN